MSPFERRSFLRNSKNIFMKLSLTHWIPKLANKAIITSLAVFCCLALNDLKSQETCTYTVEMFDSFGDGWNGHVLTVTSDGVVTTHTLDMGDFGTSTFQVTHGEPVILEWTQGSFITEPSFNLLNPDGLIIYQATSIVPPGELYNELGFCPSCPAPDPDVVFITQVTDSSAFVNWSNVNPADFYIVEYGPAGFPVGTGIVEETINSAITLDSLNPCVEYDVYLAANCGIDSVSVTLGPFSFTTDYIPSAPGDTCTYKFELFDSFGDGWNGSILTATHNGTSTDYTVNGGEEAFFDFDAISNLPIKFGYTPGSFENEVTYNIVDPSGITLFSDGPFPQVGDNVFTTIACPTCPPPLNFTASDVNATNATVSWVTFPGSTGNFIIEYGPMGFTRGTGTTMTVPVTESSATLTGLTENSWYNVYIEQDCGTEFSKPIGPVMFQTIWLADVGVTGIIPNANDFCNLGADETITVDLTNFGQLPETLFEFYFAVNGEVASIPVPMDGLFTNVVGNDSTQTIDFETTWDFSQPGPYVIEAWTELEEDSNVANDTFRVEFLNAFAKPVKEDFEDGLLPEGWTTDEGFALYGPMSHNNETWVISDNVYSFDPMFNLTSTRIGPVFAGDTLSFDYRYVDFFDGLVPTILSGDSLQVQISKDCGETFETVLTIDSTNHVPTTDMTNHVILLDDYDGLTIIVRFLATWGNGDYWVDLDNINVSGCPLSFGSIVNVEGTLSNDTTGSISIEPVSGIGPYHFEWNTGDTTTAETSIIDGLAPGSYSVDIVDANGCSESLDFEVGVLVATDEVYGVEKISLFPNPTSGLVNLNVSLSEAMEFQARVMNLSGQVVYESMRTTAQSFHQELDLSNQPSGLYILQVVADGKPYHAKLMVTK